MNIFLIADKNTSKACEGYFKELGGNFKELGGNFKELETL
jgi:hypothetical protein